MALSSAKSTKNTGVLLVNLGSPDKPTTTAVRRYLREFLWDPRVVNLPRMLWWFILHFLVLPLRPSRSAKAYRKIWTQEGSPLVSISQQLSDQLSEKLSGEASVEVAMRYGQPSISDKLEKFSKKKIEQLIVLPLYPQYSSTTTASVFDAVVEELVRWQPIPSTHFISDYHQNSEYIEAVADSVQNFWSQEGRGEKLLLSFHGLPERSIKQGDPYFYQCHKTAELIADKLKLDKKDWQIVFQSRFGRAEWLKPYCIEVLQKLPGQGIKNVDVICPGFAVDCLETLEEIAITNKSIFIEAGGQQYRYIPALNANESHATVLAELMKQTGLECRS